MSQSKEAKDSDRGLTWTHQETPALIQVWSDTEIQDEFEKCKRNTIVFEKIAKRLRECGYERTAIHCRTKIKSLRKEYFNTKKENGKSGKGRKSSEFFEEMDLVLGHRPASAPPVLIDTSTSDGHESETEDQALEDNTESDDNDADAPQDSDEAQDRGATQDRDEAQYTPGIATERRRDPDLPVVSQKRKRQCTKVTAKKQNKAEKLEATLEKTLESFLKYQREADEKFEEREEKRRREEREAAERERQRTRTEVV